MELRSVVVVPARDEEEMIATCLRALAAQTVGLEAFETIVVLDRCRDGTARVVLETAGATGLRIRTLEGTGDGAGAARRLGMDAAAARLLALDNAHGLIACTDADSRPAPDWLERQLEHARRGARAIAGLIELAPSERDALPRGVRERRDRDTEDRLRRIHRADPRAEHHHFAGASMAITARAYRAVGGLEPVAALEDAAFAARLEERGIPILRPRDVRVTTSARRRGRVARGLSVDLEVSSWYERRRYRADDFEPAAIAAQKGSTTVSVVIPTKECADTIAEVIRRTIAPLAQLGLVDELVVIDASSTDETVRRAAAEGARVLSDDDVLPEWGPSLGKGDAMWRALSVTHGDVVCFLDGDTSDPDPRHLQGLLGPILTCPSVQLVKGAFERPLRSAGTSLANEGGRVTELMARPLLNMHEPRLAGFAQPLAGEMAARRSLLEAIPFPAGYGVEIGVLIDALRREGLEALAECNLGSRQNRHQPLRALGEMAYAVLAAVERRLDRGLVVAGSYFRPWDEGSIAAVPVRERPPLATIGHASYRRVTSVEPGPADAHRPAPRAAAEAR